jgi:Rieske Fe-S protein
VHSSNFQFTKGIVTLPRTEFVGFKSGKEKFLDFVIVKLEHLEFPIVIYKISESKFQAMSMRCTHQGCELTPYTTRLVCPCHGAEFNTDGTVAMGPAEDALQTFVTSADNSNVYIEI